MRPARECGNQLMTHDLALTDIGANLAHDSFDHDRDDVIQRARLAGVGTLLLTGSSLDSSRKVIELARQHNNLFATAGIHPHEARHADTDVLQQIAMLCDQETVVAVGETGLDFNRDFSPRPAQERAFAAHLQIAADNGKPVFLHQRDAHERFLPMLREYRDALSGGVVHCFTDRREALFAYLDLDMYIGVTGWICDERRGRELLELAPHIPAERLLLETDAPFLLPRSLRPRPSGRRNEPAFLTEVLKVVAEARQADPEELARQTSTNAARLFRLPT
jgi:TatD DNase family protein